jgi:hypothetical protein
MTSRVLLLSYPSRELSGYRRSLCFTLGALAASAAQQLKAVATGSSYSTAATAPSGYSFQSPMRHHSVVQTWYLVQCNMLASPALLEHSMSSCQLLLLQASACSAVQNGLVLAADRLAACPGRQNCRSAGSSGISQHARWIYEQRKSACVNNEAVQSTVQCTTSSTSPAQP